MTSPLIYFARHGQTDWNAESRLQGQADTDINALGRTQADRNGRRLAELVEDPAAFDFVASPLRRTRETMERLRTAMGLPAGDYRTDMRLMELHFGDWQGRTFAELEKEQPGISAARHRDKWNYLPPGEHAETYEMLVERVRPWLESVAQPTVCVTHGGIVRAVFKLTGIMDAAQAAAMNVPQDRILRLRDGALEWL